LEINTKYDETELAKTDTNIINIKDKNININISKDINNINDNNNTDLSDNTLVNINNKGNLFSDK